MKIEIVKASSVNNAAQVLVNLRLYYNKQSGLISSFKLPYLKMDVK